MSFAPLHRGRGMIDGENIARRDMPTGTVRLRAVDMGRKGWRFEVTAEFDTFAGPLFDVDGRQVDPGGPVRRVDTIWLPHELDARAVFRAAVDVLGRGVLELERAGGLSGLAGRLHVTYAVS